MIHNNQELYFKLKKRCLQLTRNRTSSHYKNEVIEQKGFDIKGSTADFLVGRNNNGITWMQLEANKLTLKDGLI